MRLPRSFVVASSFSVLAYLATACGASGDAAATDDAIAGDDVQEGTDAFGTDASGRDTAPYKDGDPLPDTATTGSDTSVPPGDGTIGPGPKGCGALTIAAAKVVDGYKSDELAWFDARCKLRTATMVRNDAADPSGNHGGYLRKLVFDVDGKPRTAIGSSTTHPGWGYTVNHFGSTAFSSRSVNGTFKTVFAGKHHAIHEYSWTLNLGGSVKATIQWMFATGRDHPLWTITYDATAAGKNTVNADTRSPYGDLTWDGAAPGTAGAQVSGVGWGDHYKFVSTKSPVDMSSGWDYTQPNTIPYAMMWTNSPDAEMGSVQTQAYKQHDAGGYWFYSSWGKKAASGMPEDYNWAYQLNQYEIPFLLTSKRLAWGANFGAVGQEHYNAIGDEAKTLVGWPFQSYSVSMVLGKHTEGVVAAQVTQMETAQRTALTASVGTVITSGPAGVGRSDTATYVPAGWDHVYGAWATTMAGNAATVQLSIASGSLVDPMFAFRNYTATTPPAHVLVAGKELVADDDYFASVDPATKTLWLTLGSTVSGTVSLEVKP
jgi:hypothetical protein